MAAVAIEGGCLCGAVRYRATAAPTISMICHCASCRRASAAPAVAWLTFAAADFAFIAGDPAVFASSPPVLRTFCRACGTPLTYANAERPSEIDATTASLDDPNSFPPTHHSWLADDVSWLRFGDGLPAYHEGRPE